MGRRRSEVSGSLFDRLGKVESMVETPQDDDQGKVEVLVYFVVSPDEGPGHRIFEEENVVASGGVHAAERVLENENYWYGYLGRIWGEPGPRGVTYQESDFARLPNPNQIRLRVGRRNPAFGRPDLERHIFQGAFEVVDRMLHSWNQEDDGMVHAYTLKELKISGQQLARVASALHTLPRVHEIVEASLIKYWYESSLAGPQFPDLVLAEFSVNIPLQFRRSIEQVIAVEVVPFASC